MSKVNTILVVPLSALAIWMTAIYVESKFQFRAPNPHKNLKANVSQKKSILVRYNHLIRNSGLFGCWFFANLITIIPFDISAVGKFAFFVLWIASVMLYILALSWDIIVSDTDYDQGRGDSGNTEPD
jgi:hypothetical protein